MPRLPTAKASTHRRLPRADPVETSGIVRKGRTQVAGFQANALGDGILTITSTGAQYVINDWIVVST